MRWAFLTSVTAGTFPWPVLGVNVLGAVVLGGVLAEAWGHRSRVVLHDGVAIGFCGGLTTFSTFAVEVAQLLHDDRTATAVAYLTSSVAASVAGVLLGAAALRRWRAATLPVEERP